MMGQIGWHIRPHRPLAGATRTVLNLVRLSRGRKKREKRGLKSTFIIIACICALAIAALPSDVLAQAAPPVGTEGAAPMRVSGYDPGLSRTPQE